MPSRTPSTIISPMHRAIRQFQLLAEEYARPRGYGYEEGHLLLYVDVYGPCPMSELVRVLGIRPSTLTTVVARMVRRRFLAVRPGADRRVRAIAITPTGAREAVQVRAFSTDIEDRIRARVTPAELAAFAQVLAAMHATLGVQVVRGEQAPPPTARRQRS